MVFKIDIDGVLRDIVTVMCGLYSRETGKPFTSDDVMIYDTSVSFAGIPNPKKFFFVEHAEEVFGEAKPFDGVVEAMKRLKELGHIIKIVSFQSTTRAKIIALEWLERYGINYDSIVFTSVNDKSGIDGDVLIEDCPANLAAQDPLKAFRVCIDRPYNRSDVNNELRVKSVLELVERYVEAIDAQEEDRTKGSRGDDHRVGGAE